MGETDLISRQAAIDALRDAQHRFTVADEAGGFGTVKWSEDVIYFAAAERVLSDLPSVQPDRELIEQLRWERDTAIQQLKDLGYGLGEKPRTDDTISRQAAIDAHCELCVDRGSCCNDICPDLEVFKLLPSVQRWIPCSERLPEVHESGNSFSGIYMQSVPVLVYGICEGEENAQFHVVTYCDDLDGNTYWSTELDALTITEVKAWMPLPEPYKEEQE